MITFTSWTTSCFFQYKSLLWFLLLVCSIFHVKITNSIPNYPTELKTISEYTKIHWILYTFSFLPSICSPSISLGALCLHFLIGTGCSGGLLPTCYPETSHHWNPGNFFPPHLCVESLFPGSGVFLFLGFFLFYIL